jgi:hypothetical protein
MPFIDLKEGYPFPGAAAKFTMPPGPFDWQPKAWGVTGLVNFGTPFLEDQNSHFEDDNVQIGDIVYIVDAQNPFTLVSTVLVVLGQNEIVMNNNPPVTTNNVVYKIGMKAPHTLQTLQQIISLRGIASNTAHWSTVWTAAPFVDFRHDELGDIYVCHD